MFHTFISNNDVCFSGNPWCHGSLMFPSFNITDMAIGLLIILLFGITSQWQGNNRWNHWLNQTLKAFCRGNDPILFSPTSINVRICHRISSNTLNVIGFKSYRAMNPLISVPHHFINIRDVRAADSCMISAWVSPQTRFQLLTLVCRKVKHRANMNHLQRLQGL